MSELNIEEIKQRLFELQQQKQELSIEEREQLESLIKEHLKEEEHQKNQRFEIAHGIIVKGSLKLPQKLQDYKVVAFDMDSTVLEEESIEEIAAFAGKREEVAQITAAAMRGEIDFRESLIRRVALLKGVTQENLDDIYLKFLSYNPGIVDLMDVLQHYKINTILLSGGFSCFADRVMQELKMDMVRSNILEIKDGVLTGNLVRQHWGDICDGERKRDFLETFCQGLGIEQHESIAIGDGANDIPMLEWAGLSIAYRAKPKVAEIADVYIGVGDLDRVLEVFMPDAAKKPRLPSNEPTIIEIDPLKHKNFI